MKTTLEVKNLHAGIGATKILNGLDLVVNAGEVHAIMGPNGSGKSTLAQVIAGHADYEVLDGSVRFNGEDLLELEPEEPEEWKNFKDEGLKIFDAFKNSYLNINS